MEVDFIRGDSKSCLARSGRRREHRADHDLCKSPSKKSSGATNPAKHKLR
jgi:hypothetical protein